MILAAFDVVGLPAPQGSLRAFARGGRAFVTADNAKTRPWKDAVAWSARQAVSEPYAGAVVVSLVFTMPRPKGHYGAKGLLPSAPAWPHKKPDIDKLCRAVLDALTEARVWLDDSQVVGLSAQKRYGDEPGASIRVTKAVR